MIPFNTGWPTVQKKWRLKAGLSYRQLSELTTIAYPTLARYERGGTEPGWKEVLVITHVLGIPLNELFPQMPRGLDQVCHS